MELCPKRFTCIHHVKGWSLSVHDALGFKVMIILQFEMDRLIEECRPRVARGVSPHIDVVVVSLSRVIDPSLRLLRTQSTHAGDICARSQAADYT